jgi:hypothetical protein
MGVLHLGADAPVYDGCFAGNLTACLKDHAIQHEGYEELRVSLDGSSKSYISIICIEQRVQEPIVCDECRVVGARSRYSGLQFLHI